MQKVIDVSSNNGTIDWVRARADDVADAIIRCSLGYNTADKNALVNANNAHAAGVRVSYYHFAYPDKKEGGTVKTDAEAEANYFTRLFEKFPAPHMLAVDVEEWEGQRDSPLSNKEFYEWMLYFLSKVYDNTGIIPMIYSYRDYLDRHLPKTHQLGNLPLWIASYSAVAAPGLPNGWNQYYLWQYTAGATIQGIAGTCDVSRFHAASVLKNLVKQRSL